jgi:RecA/RadA recombinase
MAPADRSKALDLALAQIERAHGKGAVMRLGDEVRAPIEVIPTGSIALDVALGIGGLPRGRIVEIYGPESSGKCLTADTYVWTDRGLETIAELFARCGQPASCTNRVTDVHVAGIRMVNESGELEGLAAVTHNNRKPVLTLSLRSGRTITATHNHPLRVMSERGFVVWRKVGDIVPGDTVVSALFGAVEAASGDGLSEDEAVFLGYLVAEGSLRAQYDVRFTNWDPEVAGEYTRLAEHILGAEVRHYDGKEHVVFGKEIRARLLRDYGLEHVNAAGKAVPLCVRTGGHKAQRAFLSALFEGDGWIDPTSTVGLGTASEQLARDVQLLLFGLGVPATVSSSFNTTYQRNYWTVAINPAASHRFLEEVGFRSERRQAQVERNFKKSSLDPQLENIPHLSGLLRDLRDATEGDREFDRLAGDLFRADINLACSRQRLASIVAWFDGRSERLSGSARALVEHLRSLSESRLTFERVVEVEDGGQQPTFDVVLPATHSFVANGVLSHNTTVALHAVANAQRAGGIAAFIDAEHALDPDYAKKLGVDTDALLVSQPDTGEQALEIMDMLIRSGAIDIVVIDSVAALVPRAEIEGEMGDSHVGLQARLMSQALRKITGALSQSNTTAIFINQLREKIGVFFGSPETTTGGKALKFYASIRLDVRRIETLKDGQDAVGNRTRCKVVKNKCLAEGTRIFDPLTGITHRIEDVVHGRLPIHVMSMDKAGRLSARPVTNWFDQGVQPVLELKLRGGAAITVTSDHQVWTEHGWVEAGELRPGDRVARPRAFGRFGSAAPFTDDEARILGYLIGDGYVGGKTPVTLTCAAEDVQLDALTMAATMGCEGHEQQGYQVQFSHRPGVPNGLLALVRRAGIYGKLAWEKTVPVELFDPDVSSSTVAHLLVGLLETDGHVSLEQTGAGRVGFTTTSPQLAQQIAALLLRFGVTATVRRYDPTTKRPSIVAGREVRAKRDCYDVRVTGQEQLAALTSFLPQVGPRSRALAQMVAEQTGRHRGSQQVYLSESLRPEVLARLRARGVTGAEVAVMLGRPRQAGASGLSQLLGVPRLRRDRVERVAEALDDEVLVNLLSEEVCYVSVRSVEPAGSVPTFDVEVEEFHTLVAEGVVVHNCAPPFKQAEFDIIYGQGISREGSLIDMGVDNGIVRKSGAWYTYEGDQLGQGKENSRSFLRDNPDLADEIEKRIKEKLGIGAKLDAPADAVTPVPVDE